MSILVHFNSLIPKMSMFTRHLLFDHFSFVLIHGPNIPGSSVILSLKALDFTSITSHIHSWALFLLFHSLFFLSATISSLSSSRILGTYQSGEFIFQCPIFLPFHTVPGVLKARMLKWSAIPFSSGHVLSELSTITCLSWVARHSMAHSFIQLDKAVIQVISLVTFPFYSFSFLKYASRIHFQLIFVYSVK